MLRRPSISPAIAGCEMALIMFTIRDGWGSPRWRTKPPIGIRIVFEVPLDILYLGGDKGDRGGLSAVAEDVDFRGCGLNGLPTGRIAIRLGRQ